MSHSPLAHRGAASKPPPLSWDIFCRVIDNFGDAGVCCRLARELCHRGHHVRLFCDDVALASRLLSGSDPQRLPQLLPWLPDDDRFWEQAAPAEVVIEAFACDPPPIYVGQMAGASQPPIWINLEYLSAEPWVEEVHGLPSPQWHGPASGLTKWFFHPGFTPATGGLIRQENFSKRQAEWDSAAWRRSMGLTLAPGEIQIALFCYEQPMLQALLDGLCKAGVRAHVMATAGWASDQARSCQWPSGLRWTSLDWLSQDDFDHLLWSSDLNLVRGEDSLVRAIWAGKPFVWQLYPQTDGAHADKAEAFLDRYLSAQATTSMASDAIRTFWRVWNGFPSSSNPLAMIDDLFSDALWYLWQRLSLEFSRQLSSQADLVSQLENFVRQKDPNR
jgi:uncharacterized repeat protein (TIGR03837 family)